MDGMKLSDAEIEDEIEKLLPKLALPNIGSVIEVMRELADNIVKKQDFNLVADQQKRIEELEAHVERLRGIVGYAIKDTYPTKDYVWAISDDCCDALEEIYRETPTQSIVHIKRESLQRSVEICEGEKLIYDTGISDDLTYDSAVSDCIRAIKKEMEGLDDE